MKTLTLFGLFAALLFAPSFASAQAINVNAGPIWNQADAQNKCPGVCASVGRVWTGHWVTTVQGRMSVCNCAPRPAPSCNKSVNYHHNEAKNPGGSNRCTNHCHCDGLRTCSPHGWCQGTSRPPAPSCNKSAKYHHNEAKNHGGSNRCTNHCHCDGLRTCSPHGWCQGTARPPKGPSCVKSVNYRHDEGKNHGGSNRCKHDCHCDGLRTCSPHGWCQGTSRPPERPAIDIKAGPIWNQADAQAKCPNVCRAAGRVWTGHWVTTVPGKMSVCNCK